MRVIGAIFLAILAGCSGSGDGAYVPRDGDIIFQTSESDQSLAIQMVTDSPYSHMGLVFIEAGQPRVLEAGLTVTSTPLGDWTARGRGGHYVVKRLQDADAVLTPDVVTRMRESGRPFLGRPYDVYFAWDDTELYCSELVWKIYRRAVGVEVGRMQTFGDFNLKHPVVRTLVATRWGGQPPLAEPVISPAAVFACERLVTVIEK